MSSSDRYSPDRPDEGATPTKDSSKNPGDDSGKAKSVRPVFVHALKCQECYKKHQVF